MNITEFDKTKYGIEGIGIDTVTTKERTWSNKVTGVQETLIPVGTRVHIDFSPRKHSNRIFVTVGNEVRIARIELASTWLKGFKKAPSMGTLSKQTDNGVVSTCLGTKVEPDGWDYHGAPAWTMVLGII